MLTHNKDNIQFVTEFPCFLGHPVVYKYFLKVLSKDFKRKYLFYNSCSFSTQSGCKCLTPCNGGRMRRGGSNVYLFVNFVLQNVGRVLGWRLHAKLEISTRPDI